jgi:mannose-6-phosphate isomerase-like protein (cupin superfamily)
VHAREDEIFYVLEGEVTFMRGVEQIKAGPGTSVILPRGISTASQSALGWPGCW